MTFSKRNLAPVFGACRSSSQPGSSAAGNSMQPTGSAVQIQSLSSATDDQVSSWIVLWNGRGAIPTLQACKTAENPLNDMFSGECVANYMPIINGFAAKFTQSELAKFLEHYGSAVASVHEDTGVSATAAQQDPPWALDRSDQTDLPMDHLYRYYNTGTNVNVYIIDTGVRPTHQEFRYADGRPGSRAQEVYTSLTSGTKNVDCNGHGTHVAATVGGLTYGIAKNVTLNAVRALECLGNGTIAQVIQGLNWIKYNRVMPAVVVMSLGGDPQYALDLAVHDLVSSGVSVVVAAGNNDMDACSKSPAREPLALTIAAINDTDSRLWVSPGVGSNYGKCVDLWAPGSNILSASPADDTARELRSGTSQAVPFVAAAAALYLQNSTNATPEEVRTALLSSGAQNKVTEPPQSGVFNANVLATTPNILLNINIFPALKLSPEFIAVTNGPSGLGPFAVQISLIKAPQASVQVNVALSDASRGQISVPQLQFDASSWQTPQQVSLSLQDSAWQTVASDPFNVDFDIQSEDGLFNGRKPILRVDDRKGDTLAYPKVIQQLPFSDQANTFFFNDDYQAQCNSQYLDSGGGKDVVYYFKPRDNGTITVSLCASLNLSEAFDTKLFVFAGLEGPTPITRVACNDDFCGYQSQLMMDVKAGVAYGIVVDGFNGAFGPYQIDISPNNMALMMGSPPSPEYGQQPFVLPAGSISPGKTSTAGAPILGGSRIGIVVGAVAAALLLLAAAAAFLVRRRRNARKTVNGSITSSDDPDGYEMSSASQLQLPRDDVLKLAGVSLGLPADLESQAAPTGSPHRSQGDRPRSLIGALHSATGPLHRLVASATPAKGRQLSSQTPQLSTGGARDTSAAATAYPTIHSAGRKRFI
ncbi:hypothetical protein WJX72_004782 [[Myrmecia] bisecta]|uniref:Peptidase S8/S53 domain-containing protein n=1 Tax=[Myrmecia] bisecta TaxID=41462 RepID=A0AAW1R637_9CHLO